jgi:hypothetical protein
MMGTGDYVLGLLGLAIVAASMGLAGRACRRALLPGWSGAPAILAGAVLGLALLVAVSALLGLIGLLDGVLLVTACAILGAVAVRFPLPARGGSIEARAKGTAAEALAGEGPRRAPAVETLQVAGAVALAVVVALQWAGPTLLALDRGIYGGDSLWYHLPFAAHIAQTGSVTELLYTDPLYLNWLYPQNSELLHADALLLLGNDFLSPLLNLAWLGLALFAAWCIGRPYGAGAPATAAIAALCSANLLVSRQPGNANNDIVAIALLLASIAILVSVRKPTSRGALIVAGLAAGLALGTKLTVVPPVGALTIGLVAIAGSGERLRAAGAWLAGLVAGGGLWYARDLIVTGSPFPFVDIGPLDKPEELAGRDPYAIVHYLTDTDVWGRFFRPGLEERLGDLWPLALAAAVVGVVLWLWRAQPLERMLAAVALLAAIAYLLTPLGASGPEGSPVGFRLNIRYLAPGLALALVLFAIPPPLVERHARAWRIGSFALFAGLTALNVLHLEPIDTGRLPGELVLAAAVIGLPVAFVLLHRAGVPLAPLAAGVAVAILALAVAGRAAQDDYLDLRYSSRAPDYPRDEQPSVELQQGLGAAYDWARASSGLRVALSGTTGALFQYGLWGEDSSNEVRYVGERRERGAFGEIDECAEWIAAVNAGGYDFIVTTPAYDQDDPESAVPPVEFTWLESAGTARRIGGTGLVDIWELGAGPLDPAACGAAPTRPPQPARD